MCSIIASCIEGGGGSTAAVTRPRIVYSCGYSCGRGSLHYKRTGSLADVAELLGDSKRVASDHYMYALTDYREVDRAAGLRHHDEEGA